MQEEWFYEIENSRIGPVSLDALRKLFSDGKINQSTSVWKDDLKDWLPIWEVPSLRQVVRPVPPEPAGSVAREHLIALPIAGPWRRFFARNIDVWILVQGTAFFVTITLAKLSPAFAHWVQLPGSRLVMGWLLLIFLPIALLVEVGIFSLFGTTPGKALLNVIVTTVDGRRPSVTQYLQRQLGVYWFGFAAGLPIVSLFTMAHQHARTKSGRLVRYDEGKFIVKTDKLGMIRALMLAAVALFFVGSALQNMARTSGNELQIGSTWVNQITGRSVAIPNGWIHKEEMNNEKQPFHVFSGPGYGVSVIFAKQDLPPNMKFDQYLNVWGMTVKEKMKLSFPGQPVSFGTFEAVTLTGTMTDDKSQRIHATLVKRPQQVWLVVMVSDKGKDPASEPALKLRALLIQSIG